MDYPQRHLTQEIDSEEMKPITTTYLFPTEEEQLEDPHAVDPLAGCEEWNETTPLVHSTLLRVRKEGAAEPEEEAGISIERSEQAAFEEMKVDREDVGSSDSDRAESPFEEHEPSTSQNDDLPTHTNRLPLVSAHCSDMYRYETTFNEHHREHGAEPQLLTCDTCQRQFTVREKYMRHLRAHKYEAEGKNKFPCGTCGQEFKHGGSLKRHLRIHTGERPYVCDHCGKGFTQISARDVHHRKHTGEQPYSCSICNKRFAYKSALITHTRCHLNIKPYGCKECGKTFVQSSEYTVHLRVHSGERPYKCSVCSMTFAQKTNLNRHMFTHNREQKRMSECEMCGDSFKTTYMNIHMRTHTGEKPFKCKYCKATFATSSNRFRHEERHSDI